MTLLTDAEDAAVAYPDTMPQEALVFLDDPLARKLAVAWVACGGDNATWMIAAGIARAAQRDAWDVAASLRRNGICRNGGVTDPMAIQYIKAIVAGPLGNGGKRGRRR